MEGWSPTTTNQLMEMTTLMVATTVMAMARPVDPSGSSSGPLQAVSGKWVQLASARSAASVEIASRACSSMRRIRTQATTPVTTASTKCA